MAEGGEDMTNVPAPRRMQNAGTYGCPGPGNVNVQMQRCLERLLREQDGGTVRNAPVLVCQQLNATDIGVPTPQDVHISRIDEAGKEPNEPTLKNTEETDGTIRVKFTVEYTSVLVLHIRRSVAATTKVGVLKKMLEVQMNIPVNFQGWYLRGQQLMDCDTLGGQNIQDNSLIHVVELAFVRE